MLLKFLRSAPDVPRIQDKATVDKKYKYWRMRTLYGMYAGYAIFYFTRKSFTFAMPQILSTLHYTKEDLGLLGTLLYIIYGCSKFLSGMLSDRSSPRYFMAVGLIMTGFANIFFGLTSLLWVWAIFWAINAFFQGWGWPPCARLLTHWYSKNERGRWWAVWNTSHNAGGALIPLIVAGSFLIWHGWQAAMFAPGIIAILMGFFIINRLRDVPTTLGLPPVEDWRNDHLDTYAEKDSNKEPIFKIFVKYIVRNKYIWLLAFSYTLIYIVRTGLNDWGAVYLHEHGASVVDSDAAMAFFELGGFIGSLAAGWMSDIIFRSKRGPVNVIYAALTILAVLGFWYEPGHLLAEHAAWIFAIGFLIFGPQMLIGMAAAELTHKESAGTSTGFVGLFAYIGAALSGFPLGAIIQNFRWHGFFMTITVCAIGSTLLLLPLWSVTERPKMKGVDY